MSDEITVGDFVTLSALPCRGVVYRVDSIIEQKYESWCICSPVFGMFGANVSRGVRHQQLCEVTKVDIVSAGLEHLRMIEFIKCLSKQEGGE